MSPDQPVATETKPSGRKWLWRFVVGCAVVSVAGLLLVYLNRTSALSPDDPPEKVYQRVFDAYGGQAAIDRWKCSRLQYKVVAEGGESANAETVTTETYWLPGRSRIEVRSALGNETKGTTIGSNGVTDWMRDERGRVTVRHARQMTDPDAARLLFFYHPVRILFKGEKLFVNGAETRPDGGRDLVVTVGEQKAECRIDTKTKLLRDHRGMFRNAGSGELEPGRYEYSDYQQTEGGPVPGRIVMFTGERKSFEFRFVSVEFKEDFDPIIFDPPDEESGR